MQPAKRLRLTDDEQHSFAADFTYRNLNHLKTTYKALSQSASTYRKAVSNHTLAIQAASKKHSVDNPEAMIEVWTDVKKCATYLKTREDRHDDIISELGQDLYLIEENCEDLVTYYFERCRENERLKKMLRDSSIEISNLKIEIGNLKRTTGDAVDIAEPDFIPVP